jgi:amidophosphoribosyltransferase
MECEEHNHMMDKLKDECGVYGVFDKDGHDVARMTYYGLYALQHRGQESVGIAVNDQGIIVHHKDMGLVPEVFNDVILNHLKGKMAVGHVRYATTGSSTRENAQPIVVRYKEGQLALGHNGNLVNAKELREELEEEGLIFQSTNDSEIILNLIVRNRMVSDTIEEAILKTMSRIKGAYSLVIMTPERIIGIRDPLGFRPLCIGRAGSSYVLASESCALDASGAEFIRDVEPGEIVMISDEGVKTYEGSLSKGVSPEEKLSKTKLCVFEHIYFSRPDTFLDGASVYRSRLEAGKMLFKEHPVEADLVIGVPDSGLTAALGFSQASKIPYGQGLIKNRYVGRTFIKPEQGQREVSVKIKLNAIKSEVEGKRIVLVDDSIVRGTTSKRLVSILKEAGATQVHMRISSPPVKYPCFYGIDTPTREHLIGAWKSPEGIAKMLQCESLGFLSVESIVSAPKGSTCGFCNACFTGNYPV